MNAHAIRFPTSLPIAAAAPCCEITTLAALSREPEAWNALVARAAGPTPDYSRRMLEAHRDHGLTPADGPLPAALARDGWDSAEVSGFLRPVLDRRASHDAFLKEHPHKGRLKDLRRRRRRLDEAGSVTVEATGPDGDLAGAVAEFLDLERRGWKGRAGTAFACRAETAGFARDVFRAGDGPVTARADLLRLNGQVIAASLALVCGGTATLLKTAYDEELRALAPGVLLEAEIVRALHETRFADRLDSATLASAVLDDLYPERIRITEIVVSPPGGPSPERIAARARRQHAGKAWLKAQAVRLRGR